jgi:hypothetical protein
MKTGEIFNVVGSEINSLRNGPNADYDAFSQPLLSQGSMGAIGAIFG